MANLLCTCTTRLASRFPFLGTSARLLPTLPSPLSRALHAPATAPSKGRIPKPRDSIQTPADLLAASKRKLGQYESKLGTWAELFSKTGVELREAGLTATERRYLLWILEKYRQGQDIEAVAIPAKPKKKYRGWGPKVQFGKRIRG